MPINPLQEDLNRIQGLVIPGIDADVDIIQKLDDEPNDVGGLTPAELKAEFDKAGNIIKNYLNNDLVPSISQTVAEREEWLQQEANISEAEETRTENETTRVDNEDARVSAEEGRRTAEEGRVSAEEDRVTAEDARAAAELLRAAAEADREEAETARREAELARQSAEEDRVSETEGVVARASAEADRAEAAAAHAEEVVGGNFATKTEARGYAQDAADAVAGALESHKVDPGAHAELFAAARIITDDHDAGAKFHLGVEDGKLYIQQEEE